MLTKDDVIDKIYTAVLDYGKDWVDPNANKQRGLSLCQNVYEDANGKTRFCLGAYVLKELGFDETRLGGIEGDIIDTYNEYRGFYDHTIEITEEGLKVLVLAQQMQDQAMSWGAIHGIIRATFQRDWYR